MRSSGVLPYGVTWGDVSWVTIRAGTMVITYKAGRAPWERRA